MKQMLRALNGLRFFAAMAVVCFHVAPFVAGYSRLLIPLKNLTMSGPIALGFFYILSGFVLAHAYSNRSLRSPSLRRSFWFARFARLYPIYLLAYVLFLPMAYEKYLEHPALGLNGPRTFVTAAGLNLLAVQAWTPLSQAWNGPSWSLSVEAFFYFLFPFLIVKVQRARWSILLPILVVLWMLMIALAEGYASGLLPVSIWTEWIRNNPVFWTPLFILGIATYRLHHAWGTVKAGMASVAATLSILVLVTLCAICPESQREVLISGAAGPLLAFVVLAFSHARSASSRTLGTTLLFQAGAASYVIYIIQSPVWHIYRAVTDRFRPPSILQGVSDWQFLFYLPTLLLVAFLLQKVVEVPARRWLSARNPFVSDSTTNVQDLDPGIEAV